MRVRLLMFAAVASVATSANAAIMDTFTRTDGPVVTDSLGTTEVGGLAYLERRNSASATPITDGTANISNNKLVITGADSTTLAANLITGGAYLSGFDSADLQVGVDLSFDLATAAPDGQGTSAANQFNNTFLLMLRSRDGQLFGTGTAAHSGLVAIEIVPNGAVQVREQRPTTGLAFVRNANPFTGLATTRVPLPGVLPSSFGNGSFDSNQNGYLDAGETIRLEASLIGTSLNLFVNGLPYGDPIVLTQTSVAVGQLNGVGLHKNRIGGTLLVGVNPVVDNLVLAAIPEPSVLVLASIAATFLGCRRRSF